MQGNMANGGKPLFNLNILKKGGGEGDSEV